MDIGARIKQLREESNLSQNELAEKLNLSNKTISSWEKNRTQPHMEVIEEMCRIFACSKSYFLSDDNFRLDPDDIVTNYSSMFTDNEGKRVIVKIESEDSPEFTMRKAEIIDNLLKYAFLCTNMQIKSAADLLKSYSKVNENNSKG